MSPWHLASSGCKFAAGLPSPFSRALALSACKYGRAPLCCAPTSPVRVGPWELAMKLLEIRHESIGESAENGVCIPLQTCDLLNELSKAATSLLSSYKVNVGKVLTVRKCAGSIPIGLAPDGGLFCSTVGDPAQILIDSILDLTTRCRDAQTTGRPFISKHQDAAIRRFNEAIWNVQSNNGLVILAPDTQFEQRITGVDPDTLRTTKQEACRLQKISSALITGCREISTHQTDLFDLNDNVDVIVSLRNDIPEIRLTTTRLKAQSMYQGQNRLTCSVKLQIRRGIPVVQGDFTVVSST